MWPYLRCGPGGVARALALVTPLKAQAGVARSVTITALPRTPACTVRTITSNTPNKAQLPHSRKPRYAPLAHGLAELAVKGGMALAIVTICLVGLYYSQKKRMSLCSDFRYQMATGLFPGSSSVLAFYYWHEELAEQGEEDRARWRLQGYPEIP